MGRKRKTRWRRLSIGEISANEDEDGELGVTVISLTRSHSHSQNHSPVRRLTDRSLSGGITMTNNNKGSSSSPSLHASSTNLSSTPGGGSNSGGGSNLASSGPAGAKIFTSSGASSSSPGGNSSDKSQIPSHQNTSSPNPHSQSNNSSGYHNGHNHVPSSYNNSTHPPPNSVSSNESTSSSTGGGGGPQSGGHYNDRYHYTRENYRPPHHHHHHHHHHNHHGHHSNYNGSSAPSSHYQGSGEGGGGSSRGERGGSYHYSGHPHSHKEYQNGYHGPGHYSGYQGSSYYRNSHNNYRSSHYSGGGGASGGGAGGAEPYNGGESEGYHYPPSSRPYGGGRFRKSRTYPASNYYYPNGKSSGGASNNTSDNINRPSFNQDEYTKITTPRQDVLFKKGYLSQKKTQPSSSSVDSTSAATTPSASTNGTPDTQSTNGINSDNSEGYENGETDYVIPYDDTIYYAPPPPEAVFTDPNTGQVYYGHCSSTGEYYDAYPVSPVMVAAGYPPVYYPMMPYAPAIDWNGVPTAAPMYPYVAAPPPPPHQLPPTDDPSLVSSGLQLTDEGSAVSKADPNIFPSTTANSSGNLETKSSSTAATTSATHTGGTQGTNLKGEMKTTTSTEENGDETQTTKTESKHNSQVEECDGDGESKQRNITCTTTSSENTEELGGCKATEAKQTMKTARMTGSSERKDEEKGKESSCDLKLENVIVSKELLNSEKIGKGGKLEFQGKDELAQGFCMDPKTTTTLTSSYSAESSKSELVAAVAASAEASLTLETLNKKMNKEIENCSLKQDMSGAGEKDGKVGSFSSLPSFSSSPQPQQEKVAKFDAGKEGSDSFVEQAKVIIKSENGRENSTYSTTAFVLSSSSSSPSDPSSANESNTSSPVNDRTSLMRSQSKLASRKNVVNEEDDRGIGGESCNIEKKCNGSSSNCNSKKKKEKKNPSGLCHSNNNGSSCSTQINPNASNNNSNNNNNMKKRMEESFNKQFNLSDETDHHHKNNERGLAREQKKMMDNNNKKEEEDESRKGSGSSEDAANQESGQGSQNQMTSSTESGQIQQQQQETICSSSSFSTSASAVAASTTTEEGAIAAVQQEIEIESVNNMSSGYSKSNDRASLSSSKKPTDLTVQCPVSNGNEDVQFETLQLQQSPSLVHEPSSPDSLNTNQSVAGSEFAPGENLSMSESDFMNRTTSIDEIEEDLPQEVELPTVTTTTNEQGSESGASIVSQCPIAPSNPPAPSSKASPNEQVNEKISQNLEYKNDECVDFAQNVKTAENETLKEAIKSVPNASPKATSSSFSTPADSDNNSIQEGKRRDEGGTKGGGEGEQAPVRPQSITLAVTEWLKSQGDDALTPIIARASSSDEFEGDVEEETTTTEGSDEDDDDYDEGIQGSGRKRDDKASKLEQNQKNVYGNPWVAPSNKSGYSIVKVTRRRSRSSKNKNALENDGNSAGIGFPTSDGVCSRVAPLSSISSNNNSPPLTLTLRSASLVVNQPEKNERNGISPSHSNKYLTAQTSTCSTTSTSDDQDDCNYLTDNNYKMLNYKRNNNKHGLLHPTNSSCGSDPISKNNSINTSSVGKQSKSHVPVHDNGRSSDDAKMELAKDYYDSGMELSSPENSTSSDSMKLNETTTFPTTAAARPSPKPVMNINQKSALSVNSTSKSFPVTTTESSKLESNDGRKWNCPSPSPLLYQMGEEHNKFINIDQVVIAAPLTIVETHSTKAYSQSCSHKKTGNINETERKESDSSLSSQSSTPILQFSEPKSFSTSSPPLSSSKNYSELLRRTTLGSNNSSDTVSMVGGGDAQSLGSVPNSIPSIDERLHAEICNPQKYAKYYQFGVVFDTSDDPDQGIDTAVEDEIENENEIDSFQDIALETFPQPQPPSLPSSSSSVFKQPRKNMDELENKEGDKGEQKKDPLHHQKDQQKKSTTDALMVQRNRKLARKAKKTDGSRVSVSAPTATGVIDHEKKRNKPGCSNNNEDVLVSKSVYLEDQDEEIGTFDPKDVLESRLRRASSIATGSHLLSSIRGDDDSDIERINNNEDSVALQDPLDYVTTSALPSSQQSHLYINPFSLAVELSGSNMGKVLSPSTSTHHNNNVHVKKKKADNLEQTRGDEQDSDDDSSSFNSTLDSDDYFEDDEPPLPPYESPPSVEIPVYNSNTPAARVIRQNFYPIADPVSGAICCSIQ